MPSRTALLFTGVGLLLGSSLMATWLTDEPVNRASSVSVGSATPLECRGSTALAPADLGNPAQGLEPRLTDTIRRARPGSAPRVSPRAAVAQPETEPRAEPTRCLESELAWELHPESDVVAWKAEQSLIEGQWVRDGAWQAYHENGGLHEDGRYHRGVEDGPWTWWYEDGTKMAQGIFVHGQREGPWTFLHENGRLAMEGSYLEGEGHGLWISYDESGRSVARGELLQGEFHGYWEIHGPDGSPDAEKTGVYVAGELVESGGDEP